MSFFERPSGPALLRPGLLALLVLASTASADWQQPRDFASGPWQLESYSPSDPSAALQYQGVLTLQNGSATFTGPIYTSPTFYPYVQLDQSRDLLVLHPGDVAGAAVRFVASQSGRYLVSGTFARENNCRLAGDGVAVSVLAGSEPFREIFSSPISSDHEVDPDRPFDGTGTAPFALSVFLLEGESLRFVVLSGPSSDKDFDVTALRVTIGLQPVAQRLHTYNYARLFYVPDDPSTYVCSIEDGPPCEGSVVAPGTAWIVNYSADSQADFGVLRAKASVYLTGDGSLGPLLGGPGDWPSLFSVGGRAGFQEGLLVGGGTGSGTLDLLFTVTGSSLQTPGTSGRPLFQLLQSVGSEQDWSFVAGFSVGADGTARVSTPFTFGEPFEVMVWFYALAQILFESGWTDGASVSADYFSTAVLTGIVVRDGTGEPVPDFTIRSFSGMTYDGHGVEQQVPIVVKPGDAIPAINPRSRGVVPVAILSFEGFDAVADIDPATLRFGRTGNEESLSRCPASGKDVDGNGTPDLLCFFFANRTAFVPSDTEARLRGFTRAGRPIAGSAAVRIVPD
jgi:hypothetical protein